MTRPRPVDPSAPRDIAELRALGERQPDLAAAANLHAELATLVRRVESRLTTPTLDVPTELLQARLARGVPLASFGEFTVDWSEVRLLIRLVTDVFRRVDLLDHDAVARLYAAGREAGLPDRARAWYEHPGGLTETQPDEPDPMWSDVLQWALKPFLRRTADVLAARVPFDAWRQGRCPVCAAEPEFGVITSTGGLLLLCGRCHARWPFDEGCAFCASGASARIRTLATPDRTYRVRRCDDCERYLKVLDTQAAGRPLLPFYDPVATLPLDAAMMRR
ncbi:MAG: formate dehydrogenase accessory protein FdhE [Acidobacteria bacterium]|nr:formate dehydrogenase accessory protein FdhE [Acidobacteriota bacterium]